MSNLPPLLQANLVAAKILGRPSVPLSSAIPYDGKKPLYCRVTHSGDQLSFSVDGNPANNLDPVIGAFTNAVMSVSYASNSATTAQQAIVYHGGSLKFYMRLDQTLTHATLYVTEESTPAQLVLRAGVAPAAVASSGLVRSGATPNVDATSRSAQALPADTTPDKGNLQFIAIADDGDQDDPATPIKIAFLEDEIIVPDYLNYKTATILFGPPARDGGGEFGPMALRIDQ